MNSYDGPEQQSDDGSVEGVDGPRPEGEQPHQDAVVDHRPEGAPPAEDDTQPLSVGGRHLAGSGAADRWDGDGVPGAEVGNGAHGHGGGHPTYGYPASGHGGGWYPRPAPGPANEPARRTTGQPSGWLWPVMAVIALVIGLVGGMLGAVAVSTSMNGSTEPTVFESGESVPAPIEPEDGSVAAVAQALLPSTVQIVVRGGGADDGQGGNASGSGFVVDRRGHVITNNHVVSGAADSGRIQVIDHEGRRHDATIVGRSPVYDIAVLDVDGVRDVEPAAIGSSRSMNVGETVVAIGSPLGLSSTVTSGIVSAIDRPVTTGDANESSYINAVQTDAAINPGNSGGPLVNLRGEVVGVNSAIATMGGFAGDAGNIGVGFAIPMEQVKVTATQILRTGEARYPIIGANVNTGRRSRGAQVVEVPSGTPADRAGLEQGDIVVAVDDVAVNDGIGLIVAIRSHQPGETVTLRVRRDGEEITLRIELDAKVG